MIAQTGRMYVIIMIYDQNLMIME